MLGARLSLIHYAQSRRVGSRLIAFSAPIDTLRAKTPSPSSLGACLSLIRYAQSRRVSFRSIPGFHPPSIIPYRNHAYEANRFQQSIKLYEKTCTKLMHQKCAGTPRLENCAGTPRLENCAGTPRLENCAGTPRLENCAGTPILTNCSKNV